MNKALDINVKLTGFPVGFTNPETGERLELWFDSSIESLKKFLDLDKLALEKFEKVKQQAANLQDKLPKDREVFEEVDLSVESLDAAIDFNKGIIAVKYDLLFGDGSFEKLYEHIPDFEALEEIYPAVDNAISQRIQQQEKARLKSANQLMQKYTKKKKNKRKRNK